MLLVANRHTPREVPAYWQLGVAAVLGYGVTGGWLVRLRPRLAVGWLMLGIGLVLGGVWRPAVGGVDPGDATRPALRRGRALARVVDLGGRLSRRPLVLLQLLPDGRPLPGRWRAGVWLGELPPRRRKVLWAVTPYDLQSEVLDIGGARNPAGLDAAAAGRRAAGLGADPPGARGDRGLAGRPLASRRRRGR